MGVLTEAREATIAELRQLCAALDDGDEIESSSVLRVFAELPQLIDDAERLAKVESQLLRIAEIVNAELPDGEAPEAIGDVLGGPF